MAVDAFNHITLLHGLSCWAIGVNLRDHNAVNVGGQAQLIAESGREVLDRNSAQRSFRRRLAHSDRGWQIGRPFAQGDADGEWLSVPKDVQTSPRFQDSYP